MDTTTVNVRTRQSSTASDNGRQACGHRREERVQTPAPIRTAHRTCRQREDDAFDQQLSNQPAADRRRARTGARSRDGGRLHEPAAGSPRWRRQSAGRTRPPSSSTSSAVPHAADELFAQRAGYARSTRHWMPGTGGRCRRRSPQDRLRPPEADTPWPRRPISAKLFPPRKCCCSGVSVSSVQISGFGANPRPAGSSPADGNRNQRWQHADDGRRIAVERDRSRSARRMHAPNRRCQRPCPMSTTRPCVPSASRERPAESRLDAEHV